MVWGESREGELEAVGEQEGLEVREVDSREVEVKNRFVVRMFRGVKFTARQIRKTTVSKKVANFCSSKKVLLRLS